MIIMYDSITADDIPSNAPAVAGYIDESGMWGASDWNRFSTRRKLRIARSASTDDGHVLDIETGAATPEQAPGWIMMRRKSGLIRPLLYFERSKWDTIKSVLSADKQTAEFWIGAWVETGPYHIDGAWGVQFASPAQKSGGHFDLSLVDESYWDTTPTPQLRTIQFGDFGDDVAYAQELLALHGFIPNNSRRRNGTWDGIFGQGTLYQTYQFQDLHGLIGDGIIGPKTWQALVEHP